MIRDQQDANALFTALNVSRETILRLERYRDLLGRWNQRINLVSRSTIADAWRRHFADSAQLWLLLPPAARSWLDLGAGAGFPGMVVAILATELAPTLRVGLVESDLRKAAFLQAAATSTEVAVEIFAERIESLPQQRADVLSARALAPLDVLLGYAEKHRRAGGICLFPKGETVHKEITVAERNWRFEYRLHPSRTEPKAAIVEIGALARA